MTDCTELKRLAEACVAAGEYLPGEAWAEDRGYCPAEVAFLEFAPVATPAAVLALIADNERLVAACQKAEQIINIECKASSFDRARANLLETERNQLKAELEKAQLIGRLAYNFDGYKFVLDERDQLKAENEALLIALKGMTSMYGYCWDLVDGGLLCMQDNVQRFEGAHEAAQKVVGAMGNGEPSEGGHQAGHKSAENIDPEGLEGGLQ